MEEHPMLRNQLMVWIAALGLTLIATPESPAQRRGGGGGGRAVVHASASRGSVGRSVAPARVATVRPGIAAIGASRGQNLQGAVRNQGAFQNRGNYGNYGNYGRGYGNYGPGFWGNSFFFGNAGLGYWGWPSAYPYSNGYYDAYYPPLGYGDGVMPPAGYYGGAAVGDLPTMPPAGDVSAHIDVIVPDPDATVWFNGYQTSSRGTTRHFDSPALQPGVDYSYTVRATWNQGGQPMSAEHVVRIGPGARVLVDFTRPPLDVPIAK